MRAVVVEQTGGPEVLRVGEAPVPGPGDVLVDVAAAGVNFIDVYERTGGYPKELPFVLGSRERAPSLRSATESPTSPWVTASRGRWSPAPGTPSRRPCLPSGSSACPRESTPRRQRP